MKMNTAQTVLGAAFLMIFFISIGVIIGWNMKSAEIQNTTPHAVNDTLTKSTAESSHVYVRTENRYFYPGDTLICKENGAYRVYDPEKHDDDLLWIVTDEGEIKLLK